MPKWIHDRARHIQDRNPSMPSSEAFAIATQQAHALNKSPKDYGTVEGRLVAADKYRTPQDDAVQADPHRDIATTSTKTAWKDQLPGGLADHKTPGDFSQASLRKGMGVEREHVAKKSLQKEIAMDHLTEDPHYYEKLETIEKKGTLLPPKKGKVPPGFEGNPLLAFLKHAFETSMYSGPLSYGPFPQASSLPPFRQPELARKPVKPTGATKEAATPLTPAGRLVNTSVVGKPKLKVTAPAGPSIHMTASAQGVKTPKLPGAGKGSETI